MNDISLVIPARNESESLPSVLDKLIMLELNFFYYLKIKRLFLDLIRKW